MMKQKPKSNHPYLLLKEFNQKHMYLHGLRRLQLYGLLRYRQLQYYYESSVQFIFQFHGVNHMVNKTVFQGLTWFVVIATLALVPFPATWQILANTAWKVGQYSLSLSLPFGLNWLMATVSTILILAWPVAVLSGAYQGLTDRRLA